MGILDEEVIALGGRDYTTMCQGVWPNCQVPLDGVGGIGKHLKWLKSRIMENTHAKAR